MEQQIVELMHEHYEAAISAVKTLLTDEQMNSDAYLQFCCAASSGHSIAECLKILGSVSGGKSLPVE